MRKGGGVNAQYTVTALTESSNSSLLRLIAVLGRHRIEIERLTCSSRRSSGTYKHVLTVRSPPESIRRAVKQIGGCVGVLGICYRLLEETVNSEKAG